MQYSQEQLFLIEQLWWLLLNSNLILATHILTKTKRSYFHILKIATQTKQILQILLSFCTLLTSRKRKLMRRNAILSLFNIKCISWSNTANYVAKTWFITHLIPPAPMMLTMLTFSHIIFIPSIMSGIWIQGIQLSKTSM